MTKFTRLIFLLVLIHLAGCATSDQVLFVTKSSIGIDVDSKPPGASIAYDRVEGYLGPRYDNGAVPPVIASIQTDGSIFNPEIRQLYATGNAALNLTNSRKPSSPDNLVGDKELMFFGTTTVLGFKVGFTSSTPDSFTLGYKRKEFSVIPLGKVAMKDSQGNVLRDDDNEVIMEDRYPAVLAVLDTRTKVQTLEETSLRIGQFFATGKAAEEYANNSELKKQIQKQAEDAFAQYRGSVKEQEHEALGILRCFSGVRDEKIPDVLKNASKLDIFFDKNTFSSLSKKYQEATNLLENGDQEGFKSNIHTIRLLYADDIGIVDGKKPERTGLLKAHKTFVCDLLKSP